MLLNTKSRLLLLAVLLWSFSCTTKPELSSDLPEISFQNDILPIMSANCALSGCHNGSGHEARPLTSYDEVVHYAKANDPQNSDLYRLVTRYYSNEMPPRPAARLTDEQITQIYLWIEQGATDN